MKGIAIVGLGTISEVHARAISGLEGCRLMGGYSHKAAAREAFAAQWSCKNYSSFQDLLADPGVDIVVVCTPSGAHFEATMAALRAGKHVIVEKPLEVSRDKCRLMVEEAKKARRQLGGVFQSRFYPSSLLIKTAVEKGRFGRLSIAQAQVPWYRSQEYYSSSSWRGTWALDGGGAYMNQAIHMVDLLRWILGEPDSLHCRAAALGHDGIEVEDSAVAILEWKGRGLGILASTTASFPGFPKRLEVTGMGGTAVMEEDRLTEWRFRDESEADEDIRLRYGVGTLPRSGFARIEPEEEAHRRQYLNYLAALEGKEALVVDGEEASRSVGLILDLYRSAGIGPLSPAPKP